MIPEIIHDHDYDADTHNEAHIYLNYMKYKLTGEELTEDEIAEMIDAHIF